MNLTLHNVPADATANVSAGGPPATVTVTTPGQNANVIFAGTAGVRITVNVTDVTISSSSITILKPDGTTLATFVTVGTSGVFFEAITLPATGNYSVFINPKIAAIGNATVTVYDVSSDLTDTIMIGGPPVSVSINTPGQNAQLTFTGTAGQIVELDWNGTILFSNSIVFIKPDGSVLIDDYGWDDDDIYRLPVSGTYTIQIDPFMASVGTTTFTLYEIPELATTSIQVDGPPVTVAIPTVGQFAKVTFSGTAGQRVSLKISDVKIPWAYVEVTNPNGSWIGDTDVSPEWEFDGSLGEPIMLIDTMTLQTTGNYTITVYPDFSSGSITFQLYNVPPDATATIVC